MHPRAAKLLSLPDHVLFAHGGCHVFACVLHEFSRLPFLWIHDNEVSHDHIACDPGNESLLDCFGQFSFSDYRKMEFLDDRVIQFDRVEFTDIQRRFTKSTGRGFFAHDDFIIPARDRALAWIERYRTYFDGTFRIPIPGLSRTSKESDDEMLAIFD